VDGHYYAYRSFYAIRHLSNSKSEPTNAIYGVVKALKKMSAELQPTHAAIIFDAGLAEERLALVPEYKSTRSETPSDLEVQFDGMQKVAPSLGFGLVMEEGREADDLIASYARTAKTQGMEVVIATNDKDIMQVVDDQCWIYHPESTGYTRVDSEAVYAKWGVPPNQIVELLALTGDAVDDIAGVPGVGPKTAASWLKKFESLENLFQRAEEISSEKLRASLLEHRERVEKNIKMVRLLDELPLPVELSALGFKVDWKTQAQEFERLEFKSFLKEALQHLPAETTAQSQQQAEWLF